MGGLLALAADVVQDEVTEAAFWCLAEVVVASCLLAHDGAAAVIAGIEPLCRRVSGAAGAVEPNPRAHLYERTALGKLCRFFVLYPHEG